VKLLWILQNFVTMHRFWDERYAEEGVYGHEPNPFWADQLSRCTGTHVLLPCEGEGRNAVWAAKEGWNVEAFDGSGVATATCLRWAQQAGVQLQATHADAFQFEGRAEGYDVVGLFYAHMPEPLRKSFHTRAMQWLRPGGTLLLEAFNSGQLRRTSGGPRDEKMLFTESLLSEDFIHLHVSLLKSESVELNEGPYHQGPAEIIRLVAHKPH